MKLLLETKFDKSKNQQCKDNQKCEYNQYHSKDIPRPEAVIVEYHTSKEIRSSEVIT